MQKNMFEEEYVPYAIVLIESMRSLGYSFQSAVVDLSDMENSF